MSKAENTSILLASSKMVQDLNGKYSPKKKLQFRTNTKVIQGSKTFLVKSSILLSLTTLQSLKTESMTVYIGQSFLEILTSMLFHLKVTMVSKQMMSRMKNTMEVVQLQTILWVGTTSIRMNILKDIQILSQPFAKKRSSYPGSESKTSRQLNVCHASKVTRMR